MLYMLCDFDESVCILPDFFFLIFRLTKSKTHRLYIPSQTNFQRQIGKMPPPNPDWVTKLTPSGPQGSELLERERAKSNLPVDKLADFLFTKEALDRRQKILEILQSEQIFDKSQNYFAGRVDRVKTALSRAKRLTQLRNKHGWTDDDYLVANELISEPTPYGLHDHMFLASQHRFAL